MLNRRATVPEFVRFEFYDNTGAAVPYKGVETEIWFDDVEIFEVEIIERIDNEVTNTANGYAVSQAVPRPREASFQIDIRRRETFYKLQKMLEFLELGHVPGFRIATGALTYDIAGDSLNDGSLTYNRAAIEFSEMNYRTIIRGAGQKIGMPSEPFGPRLSVREALELQLPQGTSGSAIIIAGGGQTVTLPAGGFLTIGTTTTTT